MDEIIRNQIFLINNLNVKFKRDFINNLNINEKLIGIKGTRGVGKTTLLLQFLKEKKYNSILK